MDDDGVMIRREDMGWRLEDDLSSPAGQAATGAEVAEALAR